ADERGHLEACSACTAALARFARARRREALRRATVLVQGGVRLLGPEDARLDQSSPDGRLHVSFYRDGGTWVLRVVGHDAGLDRLPVRYFLADAHRQSARSGLLALVEEGPGRYGAREFLNACALARELGDVCPEVQILPIDPEEDLRPAERELYQVA